MVVEHWCSSITPVCTKGTFPFSVMDTNDEMEKGSLLHSIHCFPCDCCCFFGFFKVPSVSW